MDGGFLMRDGAYQDDAGGTVNPEHAGRYSDSERRTAAAARPLAIDFVLP